MLILRRYLRHLLGLRTGIGWKEVNDKWARYLDKNYASGEIDLLKGEKCRNSRKMDNGLHL